LEFRDISRVSEAVTAKRMKNRPVLSATKLEPSDVQIALISQVVPQLGGVKQR